MVQQQFAQMPQGERNVAPEISFPQPHDQTIHLDKQQAVLTVGFHGCSVSSEDTHALELISDYCSDMAGPLFTKIREELGLAYYVSAMQFYGVNTGMFAFYLGTSPDQLELAKTNLLQEIETIANQGIPEDKLECVKTTWLASNALSNQKLSALAQLTAINSLLGLEPDQHLKAPEQIQSLTHEEIKLVAQKYLASQSPVQITVTPQKK